ncbi:MAG: serine/threonine protein kinase, partial [Deltaproteobacteria bacterium]
MSDASPGNLVGQRLGKYDLLALLAVGGTAEIYLARIGGEAGFEKFVVCKCLLEHLADEPEYVHMFLDEARIGAQLDHSNIVQTLELGEQDGRYYMVMEYLAGMSLSTFAKKAQQRVPGGLPVDLCLSLCAQACAGLHYAHERTTPDGQPLNIIHRDISPQNLVVSFEGVLKIVDFGIAKAELRATKTRSGTIKGKFAYMSPEQCLGKPLDRRTDIFALGTILWELLTGRRLFKRDSTYDTYHAIVRGEVVPPSHANHQLDPQLDELVMRALAYNRQDRYPTAEAFGEALLQTLHRRGKSPSAAEIAQFFDAHFSAEIETHAERMRELLTGGRATLEDISWHAADLASDSASEMPDDAPARLDTLPAAGARDATDSAWADDDEADAGEATRIEPNPLLRVQTLHAQQKREEAARGAAAPAAPAKPAAAPAKPAAAPAKPAA